MNKVLASNIKLLSLSDAPMLDTFLIRLTDDNFFIFIYL